MQKELIEKILSMSLEEIESRIAEIDKEVRGYSDAEMIREDAAQIIEERTAELKELKARMKELKEAQSRAQKAKEIAEGEAKTATIETRRPAMPEDKKTYTADSPEYRIAWLKSLAIDERGNMMLGEMTPEERSAFTFLTSNASAVVPTVTLNRIIDLVKFEAPMIDDADQTYVENVFEIPRRTAIAQGDAAVVAEGSANDDEQDTFELYTLTGVDIKKHAIMSRRMKFQSIDAFENWLIKDISKRIRVAKEGVALARLSGSSPGAGESANNYVKIASGNVLTSQTYTDATIRSIFALLEGAGEVVIYANQATIWNGLAGILDDEGKKIMIPNSMVDPIVQGRIYGANVKKDPNLANNVVYFGIKGALKVNDFGPMEVFGAIEPKTANRIYTGAVTFDAGLENPKSFVKATFTT